MTRISTLLFLWGTVAVACNGAVLKGRPCEDKRDEEIKTEEQVMVNIPEAPMLPPFSSNALEFVAPLQDEIKSETPEATTSLPSVPLSYQPVSIVSGDYAWPSASLYPNYPVNVLTGQAALDYPNVQIVPITDITATAPETSQIKEESLMAIPQAPVLPPFEAGMVLNYSQSEGKVELPATPDISNGVAPFLPSWPAISQFTPNFLPYQQIVGNSRDEVSVLYQQPWSYYPIAPRPCVHDTGSSPANVETKPNHFENLGAPVMLPFYAPVVTPETESKPISSSFLETSMLPSFSMPELPTTNVVANDEAPAKEDAVLMIIPEAPILPPFVLPETPKEEITLAAVSEVQVPAISQNDEVLEPVPTYEKEVQPISIPEAPVLPPFVAPELYLSAPTTKEPQHEDDEEPKITEAKPIYVSIPEAPVLPAFVTPELHISAETEVPATEENFDAIPESEPLLIIIPEAPVLPPFTAPLALPITATMNDEPKPEPASPSEELKEEKYESFAPILIPTAPVLPPFVAPEIPMKEEKYTLPMSTEAPAAVEVLYEEPESEPQQFIPIPAAPVLPAFVAPEMPTQPMYDEPKSKECDKDTEYKPIAASYPYYLPIPANYALSPQSGVALPDSTEAPAAVEVLYEEPESEPQQFIPIPAAPVLPAFVAPEMPTQPMYDEPKSEDCDKDNKYKPITASYPYYLPIPANYALSSQSGVVLPESAESIGECIRKILSNRVSPSFYASLVPAAQNLPRAPIVPLSSPFYYKPAISNDLPVY